MYRFARPVPDCSQGRALDFVSVHAIAHPSQLQRGIRAPLTVWSLRIAYAHTYLSPRGMTVGRLFHLLPASGSYVSGLRSGRAFSQSSR